MIRFARQQNARPVRRYVHGDMAPIMTHGRVFISETHGDLETSPIDLTLETEDAIYGPFHVSDEAVIAEILPAAYDGYEIVCHIKDGEIMFVAAAFKMAA